MTLSIRARLMSWYLVVLVAATLTLALGAWALFSHSILLAADASLAARVSATRGFIENIHKKPKVLAELRDEFHEYAELTLGQALLEVTGEGGLELCRPTIANWEALRASLSSGTALKFENREAEGEPFRAVATTVQIDGHAFNIYAASPMGLEYVALRRFGLLLAALVPGVLLFAAAGGYWISRRALAPVDRMTRDVQSISLRNLDRRLAVPGAQDELRQLAVTFNDMLARLEGSVADIVRFTAEASHELRTPVSLVRTTAEITLSRERTPDEYREAFSDVLAQTERMSILVADLLTLARADAGVEGPQTSQIELQSTVADVAREVRPAVARRGLTLSLELPLQPVLLSGSPESLRRLVLILLDNAVKYTSAGGTIGVRVSAPEERDSPRASVVLEVVDTGPGIDPAERPHVFDRFYRGASARQQVPDGSGLGLAIARAIVERHGGTITIGARPDGPGCQVQVRLPTDKHV